MTAIAATFLEFICIFYYLFNYNTDQARLFIVACIQLVSRSPLCPSAKPLSLLVPWRLSQKPYPE
jgi:hypothetical protein